MKGNVKVVLIVMVMFVVLLPQGVFAVGEYNGAWIGTETVSVEGTTDTVNSATIIFQQDADNLYFADALFGTVQLVKSGNNWILPSPLNTEFLGYSVVLNTMNLTFTSQTRLTGSINLTIESVSGSATLAFSKQTCPSLSNGVAVPNLKGGEDSYRCFQVDLPQDTTNLTLTTSRATGDCDLYGIYSQPDFDFYSSEGDFTDEQIDIPSPYAGRWYVFLYGYTSYSGVALLATYQVLGADFAASSTTGNVPLTVSFTDHSVGGITSWSWDFGDGATSTEQNPNHTYRTPGTYTVSLTVTGPAGSNTEEKTGFISALRSKSMPWVPLLLGD